MENLWQDLRYGLRILLQKPAFTIVAVLTIGLGIGANTAMFSIINGVLLRPLPYADPDRLMGISSLWADFEVGMISQPEYMDLLDRSQSFASLGLYRSWDVNLAEGTEEPERLAGVRMTPSVLETLKVQPQLGREFSPEDGEPGSDRVVLLSWGLWQRRFGANPEIVGQRLILGGESFMVRGVMPNGFAFPDETAQIWTAYKIDRANLQGRPNHSNTIIARLKPGVSREQAGAELDTIAGDLRQIHPDIYPEVTQFSFYSESYAKRLTGRIRPAILMLMGAVGFVLLIACANVANLLLAGIIGREKELAVRAALGAGRGRILRQLLTESLVLSTLGGVVALGFAWFALHLLLTLQPGDLPRTAEIRIDTTVFAFNMLLTLLTGIAFGLIPAWKVSRIDLQKTLKAAGRASAGFSRQRTRALLVVAEVAFATILLMSAGLLLRSFQKVIEVDPGFQAKNLLTTQISLDEARYPEPQQRAQFYFNLIEALKSQPEITGVGGVTLLPMAGRTSNQSLEAEGYSETRPSQSDFFEYRLATPDYFKTIGIPLIEGRAFTDEDRHGTPQVAILSESLARKFWGDADPLGRRIRSGPDDPWITVVGIVGDIHHSGLANKNNPIWYRPYYQANAWPMLSLVVRTRTGSTAVLERLHEVVSRLDPLQPIYNTSTMQEVIAGSLAQKRFSTLLLFIFAALALGLAALGIYGVISYSVGERTHELGIRMALGASRHKILKMVIGQGLRLTILGLGIGLVGALFLTRYLETLLFGISASDPLTFAAITLIFTATSMLACFVPARRATRVDPLIALRQE